MNKNKRKGNAWEYQARDLLNSMFPNTWKRLPTSGAIGTIVEIPHLTGDLIGRYYFIPYVFRAECKVGYGGKEMKVKKEWFDKIRSEAEKNFNNIPCILIKFENARDGVKYFIGLDFQAWFDLLSHIQELYDVNVQLLVQTTHLDK